MAGFINSEDLEEVRSRARIDDVVGSYVTLKAAGAGSFKGLCPFHDEKTPSFQVTPARGLYYCFGCGKGGDIVDFVQEISNLSFREAVEFLADKYGVQLRYTEEATQPGVSRVRLYEANASAAQFFAAMLETPGAKAARAFLDQRGFPSQATKGFSVGFAPRGGRDLVTELKARGFSEEELLEAGLMRQGGWDFFQGRLIWPIRDTGNTVLGFGARRLFDDDRMSAKYINTPETPIYRKSHVLYGLDLARTAIGSQAQAVIVEGYTDVMACHLAGVTTAVASCGTAFGSDHAKKIQHLMGDHAYGQVIFTFDGDEAGRNAALKVFKEDSVFSAQTYVAIDLGGLDPCDVRLARGDQGVRDLIESRVPLYRFVMDNILSRYDLDHADGQISALRQAVPLVGSIRDASKKNRYISELAKMVGVDQADVLREMKRSAQRQEPQPAQEPVHPRSGASLPSPDDRRLLAERDTLKLILQAPELFETTPPWGGLGETDFSHGAYRALFRAIETQADERSSWPAAVIDSLTHEDLKDLALQLSVDPPQAPLSPRYAREYIAKLKLVGLEATLAQLKSKLARMNPLTEEDYHPTYKEMVDLEVQRKALIRLLRGE